MRKLILVVVCVLVLLDGCADSPELRLEQARIAIANGKLDRALKIVSAVLEQNPDNLGAQRVKVRTQILLGQFDESKKLLDRMVATHPGDVVARRHLLDWAWFRMRRVLRESDYANDPQLHARFEEALLTGREQARWLSGQVGCEAEGLLYQARCAGFDARVDSHQKFHTLCARRPRLFLRV